MLPLTAEMEPNTSFNNAWRGTIRYLNTILLLKNFSRLSYLGRFFISVNHLTAFSQDLSC